MFIAKTRTSTYTLRLSSPRITPSNSLSDFEWNDHAVDSRKSTLQWSHKKIKCYALAIGGGLAVAIIILIAILIPLIRTSKSPTTKTTETTSGVIGIINIPVGPTNSLTTALPTTATATTFTTTETTTTESTSLSTISNIGTTTESTTSSTTFTSSTTEITSTTTPPLRWNTTGILFAATGTWGSNPNQVKSAQGLAFDSSNVLYISDTYNNRVQKYLANTSTSVTVAGLQNGTNGTGAYELYLCKGIAIDPNDNLFIADVTNNRIQIWNNRASFGVTIAGNGTAGNTLNLLNRSNGITIDPASGTLYIADTNNHRVMRYLSGATTGSIVAGGKGGGFNNTQLYLPTGIYFDSSSNSLIIGNLFANNVVRWILGANSWTVLAGDINGTNGSTPNLLNRPEGVLLDPMGNLYVADRYNHRVQFFRAGEINGTTIAGNGVSGYNLTQLNQPIGLALDNQLNLYVADAGNSRILKFLRI